MIDIIFGAVTQQIEGNYFLPIYIYLFNMLLMGKCCQYNYVSIVYHQHSKGLQGSSPADKTTLVRTTFLLARRLLILDQPNKNILTQIYDTGAFEMSAL